MTTLWSRAALIGAGVLVLLMGAGIWRSATQARETPRAVAASAPNRAVTGDSPSVDGPATPEDGTPAAEGKTGAQEAFEALMERLREKAKEADQSADKQAFVSEIIGELQEFIEKHPGDPVADQASMAIGQLQIRSGKPGEAVVTFRGVAEHGADPEVKRPAEFMMAQALALAGSMELAKAKLTELGGLAETGKTAQEKEVGTASRQLLEQLSRESAVRAGAKPPAFTAKDLEGRTHSLDQYRGKVVLIDFWATWCGPCLKELPMVKAAYEKYRDRGLVVLGVNLDEDRASVERFVKARGLDWPQLFDGKGWRSELAQQYGVTAIPRAILIDREGVIRNATVRGHELDATIGAMLK